MFKPRGIEWTEANAEAHFAKHGVRFEYAARVFLDQDRADFDASRAEDGEERRKSVGMIEGKLYVVLYAPRRGRGLDHLGSPRQRPGDTPIWLSSPSIRRTRPRCRPRTALAWTR